MEPAIKIPFERYGNILQKTNPIRVNGKVGQIVGLVLEGQGPGTSIGEICQIYPHGGGEPINAEVVGFKRGKVLLMPLESMRGIGPGCRIVSLGRKAEVKVGMGLLGRVIDGLGSPIDNLDPVDTEEEYPITLTRSTPCTGAGSRSRSTWASGSSTACSRSGKVREWGSLPGPAWARASCLG